MFRIKQFGNKQIRGTLLPVLLFLSLIDVYPEDSVPWALRDHYSFTAEHARFMFDVKTAEWRVEVPGRGAVVESAQCEIEFADGEVLRLSSLEAVRDEREKFSGPMGEGTHFRSYFRSTEGLEIGYSVARFKGRPFLLIHVTLKNTGNQPIEIKAVRPVVWDPGTLSPLSDSTKITRLRMGHRGIFPVIHSADTASLIRFELSSPEVTFGIGFLQTGLTESFITLEESDGLWAGAAVCDYKPSLRIEPGKTIGTDPVWLSFSMAEPGKVQQFHAWAESTGVPTLNVRAVPLGWITVDPKQSVTVLYEAALKWKGTNVNYVLVPDGWEQRPGSLRGQNPFYPRRMEEVAAELRSLGMRPGITVDPLAVVGAKKAWVMSTQDGTSWLDVTDPNAFEFGILRMQEVAAWGFTFFVVKPSSIPDEVLREFNITRAQADSYALQMVARAARGRPVLPTAGLTLGDDVLMWQQAASYTAYYEEYGLVAGPIRLRLDGLKKLSPALAAAIGQFAGPVELVGLPHRKVRHDIASLRFHVKRESQRVSP